MTLNDMIKKECLLNNLFLGIVVQVKGEALKGRVRVAIPGLTASFKIDKNGDKKSVSVQHLTEFTECYPAYPILQPANKVLSQSTLSEGNVVAVAFYENNIYNGVIIGTMASMFGSSQQGDSSNTMVQGNQ